MINFIKEIVLAVIITVYVDTNKMKSFFKRKAKISIPAAIAFRALTPLRACGSTTEILHKLRSRGGCSTSLPDSRKSNRNTGNSRDVNYT